MKIFATTVLLSGPLGILAQSPNNEAASITKDFGCGGFVPVANGDYGLQIFSDQSHSVTTPSGNLKLICNFNIPDGLQPATATHTDGFLCGTYLGTTTDSTMVATPGGKAVLTCEIKHA